MSDTDPNPTDMPFLADEADGPPLTDSESTVERMFADSAGQAVESAEALAAQDETAGIDRTENVHDDPVNDGTTTVNGITTGNGAHVVEPGGSSVAEPPSTVAEPTPTVTEPTPSVAEPATGEPQPAGGADGGTTVYSEGADEPLTVSDLASAEPGSLAGPDDVERGSEGQHADADGTTPGSTGDQQS